MEPIRVRVEPRHIAAGVRHDCRSCPIALAVADAVRPTLGDVGVEVGGSIFVVPDDGWSVLFMCPPRAEAEWTCFDMTGQMQPFEFDLVEAE